MIDHFQMVGFNSPRPDANRIISCDGTLHRPPDASAEACAPVSKNRSLFGEPEEPQHSDGLMSQSLDAAATDLAGAVLALPYLLSLLAHFTVPERVPGIASSRHAGRPKAIAADLVRHQAARTPDAVALRPGHNAGAMVAAELGRSPVWGRSVADQLWSPWDIPRGNRRDCRRVGS